MNYTVSQHRRNPFPRSLLSQTMKRLRPKKRTIYRKSQSRVKSATGAAIEFLEMYQIAVSRVLNRNSSSMYH